MSYLCVGTQKVNISLKTNSSGNFIWIFIEVDAVTFTVVVLWSLFKFRFLHPLPISYSSFVTTDSTNRACCSITLKWVFIDIYDSNDKDFDECNFTHIIHLTMSRRLRQKNAHWQMWLIPWNDTNDVTLIKLHYTEVNWQFPYNAVKHTTDIPNTEAWSIHP